MERVEASLLSEDKCFFPHFYRDHKRHFLVHKREKKYEIPARTRTVPRGDPLFTHFVVELCSGTFVTACKSTHRKLLFYCLQPSNLIWNWCLPWQRRLRPRLPDLWTIVFRPLPCTSRHKIKISPQSTSLSYMTCPERYASHRMCFGAGSAFYCFLLRKHVRHDLQYVYHWKIPFVSSLPRWIP